MSVSASNASINNIGTISCSSLDVSDATLTSAGSGHGSLRITGANDGGYNGLEIPAPSSGMSTVLMNNGSTFGFYNDTDNEWLFYGSRNAGVVLRYNNLVRLQTTSAGVDITGNITHDGLSVSSGTDIDQILNVTSQSMQLLAGTDVYTGIDASSFSTGTYIMQCTVSDNHNDNVVYTGVMPWVVVDANSADVNTIPTSASGVDTDPSNSNYFVTFKIYLTTTFNKIYMNAPYTANTLYQYQFRFRRVI